MSEPDREDPARSRTPDGGANDAGRAADGAMPPDGSARARGPICDVCGAEMFERHCKILCPVCGYQRDCSDP